MIATVWLKVPAGNSITVPLLVVMRLVSVTGATTTIAEVMGGVGVIVGVGVAVGVIGGVTPGSGMNVKPIAQVYVQYPPVELVKLLPGHRFTKSVG